MRGLKILVCAAVWLGSLTLAAAQTGNTPVASGVGDQPNCHYGYYGYAPYACAPRGFYGADYFYNGIFIGVGPWADWGYTHGWGDHRFNRGHEVVAASPVPVGAAVNPSAAVNHGPATTAVIPAASHASAPSAAIAHSGGAITHAGHGAVGLGGVAASHGVAPVGGVHAAATHSSVGGAYHPSGGAYRPSGGATHGSSGTHPSSGVSHGKSNAYHPSGAYHPPSSSGAYRPSNNGAYPY